MDRSCGDCRSAGAKHTLSSLRIRRCQPTGYGLVPVIEEVAFARIDVRLSQGLLQMADGTSQRRIRISPKGLGAREVISRKIREVRRRKWLEAARCEIELIDRMALARLAQG
jgi:CRP/FNR family transcriptional regulator, anaerobic regulatory protein